MSKKAVPQLIDALRPNLPTIAKWTRVSIWTARNWQQGLFTMQPQKRAALVKAARKHAKDVLALADAVEREGKAHDGGK